MRVISMPAGRRGTCYFTCFPETAQGRESERFSEKEEKRPSFVFFGWKT
jgi:hypothetical protein